MMSAGAPSLSVPRSLNPAQWAGRADSFQCASSSESTSLSRANMMIVSVG